MKVQTYEEVQTNFYSIKMQQIEAGFIKTLIISKGNLELCRSNDLLLPLNLPDIVFSFPRLIT